MKIKKHFRPKEPKTFRLDEEVERSFDKGTYSIICYKFTYRTAELAKEVLAVIGQRCMGRNKKAVDYYGCKLCRGYHLTSTPTSEADKNRFKVKQKFKSNSQPPNSQ